MWLKYTGSSYLTPRSFIVMPVRLAWLLCLPHSDRNLLPCKHHLLLWESPCFYYVCSFSYLLHVWTQEVQSVSVPFKRIHPLSQEVSDWVSCPLLSQLRWESMHLLEALLFLHLPEPRSYSVSSGFRVDQNIRLSSEHLKTNAVMFDFSFFIFQVKVFLSCEHTAQSSLWVTED